MKKNFLILLIFALIISMGLFACEKSEDEEKNDSNFVCSSTLPLENVCYEFVNLPITSCSEIKPEEGSVYLLQACNTNGALGKCDNYIGGLSPRYFYYYGLLDNVTLNNIAQNCISDGGTWTQF